MSLFQRSVAVALAFGVIASGVASAQLLPSLSVPDVTRPVGGVINDVGSNAGRTVGDITGGATNRVSSADVQRAARPTLERLMLPDWLQTAPPLTLNDLRKLRLQQLVTDNRATLEMDGAGNPAKRGRLIAVDPPQSAVPVAVRAGFTIASDETDEVLGIRVVAFNIPRGMKLGQAAALLRRLSPQLDVEFDHIFEPAGGTLAASSVGLAAGAAASAGGGVKIGMVDGGVARSPALDSANIEQRGFSGPAEATGHGTAVASLIVGSDGKFRGAAPGASLLVADVYGGSPAAGSATAVFKAMSWLASHRPSVVNMSLVGPRNRLVERAVAAVQARGIKVVAAVGNDGPAAPPLYPASQPGVIAVTGVDAKNRAIPEAGRAAHLDYAGPGADMAAALPGSGYAAVRGTSFASPLVAARLALAGSTQRLDAEVAKGHGRIGRGVVCAPCRVPPKVVKAK
jgi:hypothetical protein